MAAHIGKLNKGLPQDEPFRILFVEYAGSGGDVGKSMTYTEAMKSQSIRGFNPRIFNKMLLYFQRLTKVRSLVDLRKQLKSFKTPKGDGDPLIKIDMKLAVDCNYIRYMSKATRDYWQSDISACQVGTGTDEKANESKFVERVNELLTDFKPHMVIQGNAISGLYRSSEGVWTKLHASMNQMVTDDIIIRTNIRADFKQKEEALEKKEQYPIAENDIVLVGQPVDFFPGLPSVTRQTRIGRPQVAGMSEIPSALNDFLDKSTNVMYLGLGGRQRSRELPMKAPAESLEIFLKTILKDPKYKNW